ncbi:protein KRI1 homolog [Echeneis naucrates]|uniref:Protein KRI1 homolog n=1 Tax=Echeneis naucrates TaxID=173247 RepID=A0A665UMQ3_ECHNA|nr:protein KRI1 homolog [Echeneis naucrates]
MSGKSELKINSQFAQKYEKYRQKEELQRLKDRYGDRGTNSDSETESNSSSDDSEVELDPEVERDFYRTLSLLKKKDPKVYQKDIQFYSEGASTSDEKPSTSKKAAKPMYLKDYERKVILEREGKYEDDDDSDDEEAAKRRERAASPSYIQEQRELKQSFQKFIQDSDDEDEGSQEGGRSQLLTRRIKTQEEKAKEDADYVEWLKGQAELEGPEEVKDMKYLRDYWNDPELDEKERFLRDYVLNKGYLDENDSDERIPTYDEVIQDDVEDSEDEGETFLERQEDFERKYNFRFEEPEAQKIKTYPRNIATSVRSKDDRRKRKREEVKERKEKEKEHKREQLKQLKNLKRNEIMEKLKKLQELTGNEQLAFDQVDLDGDFDPQKHDQLMQKVFGDDYYGEEEEEKPQFDDEDFEEHWNWDTWAGEGQGDDYDEVEEEHNGEEYGASGPHCDDEDFIMDADYDPNQHSVSKKKKKKERNKMKKEDIPQMGKKRKKSYFAEVITKNKPVFDPQEKSFEQYLDEYYKLDYEDIIDDLPCRFRYRQVVSNDFGLSTDEILNANEKELNRWCSLKKTCMFRSEKEEMSDLKNYKIKAQNERKKREVLASLYAEEDKELAEGKIKMGKKRRDRLKNAEQQGGEAEDGAVSMVDSTDETVTQAFREAGGEEEEEVLIPKKKMKQEESHITSEEVADEGKNQTERPKWSKKKCKPSGGRLISGSFGVKIGGREFSKQRLKAYGLNPKRLYFRQLGRQKRKAQAKREKQKKE